MAKTLKKRKNRRTQKKRRTRQMTNNKTRRPVAVEAEEAVEK